MLLRLARIPSLGIPASGSELLFLCLVPIVSFLLCHQALNLPFKVSPEPGPEVVKVFGLGRVVAVPLIAVRRIPLRWRPEFARVLPQRSHWQQAACGGQYPRLSETGQVIEVKAKRPIIMFPLGLGFKRIFKPKRSVFLNPMHEWRSLSDSFMLLKLGSTGLSLFGPLCSFAASSLASVLFEVRLVRRICRLILVDFVPHLSHAVTKFEELLSEHVNLLHQRCRASLCRFLVILNTSTVDIVRWRLALLGNPLLSRFVFLGRKGLLVSSWLRHGRYAIGNVGTGKIRHSECFRVGKDAYW